MRTLYLCGAGNSEGVRLAHAINRAQDRWDRILLLDDDETKHGQSRIGVEIVGPIGLLDNLNDDSAEVVNLVARTTAGRSAVRDRMLSYGFPFAPLISPTVEMEGVDAGEDLIVFHNATMGPEVSVDEGTLVFMGAVVGHECRVGRCCVIASNAVLNARVELEDGVYVGTNATILPETKVAAGATIGAGSVVLQNVPAGATVMGVPAEIISFQEAQTERSLLSEPLNLPSLANMVSMQMRSDFENKISEIWKETLHLTDMNVEENIFRMGADSLCACRVHNEIQQTLGVDIPITDLFQFPTVRTLAERIAASARDGGRAHPHLSRAEIRRRARKSFAGMT